MAVVGGTDAVVDAAGGGDEHKLDSSLGFLDSVVMAVAGSAPAYSIAGTSAVLVGAVALAGPASLLWCGIPMFGIAVAYHQLNQMGANAGAAYSWVGRVIHPFLGFLTGWALVVSATIFMVAASIPAGNATLSLFSAHLAGEVGWETGVAAIWFIIMAYFVARGIRITANAQWVMSSIEVVLLLIFAVLGIVHGHKVLNFSLSWLGFSRFHGFSGFAAGALVAAFYYWGWDVSSNLGEETENSKESSGMGGIVGVIIVFVLFMLFTVVVNMDLTRAQINGNSADVLETLGNVVWSGAGGKLMIIAVMLSTIATLETTLIQVTRSLFSMGREQTLPAVFARLHRSWRTPVVATAVVAVVSLVLFAISANIGSVGTIMTDAITAIGLQIAVYYGLAGLAAVIGFRKYALKSVKNFFFMGLFPLLGSVFMFWIFVKSIPGLTTTENSLGLGALAIGLVPLVYYYIKGSPYLHETPSLGRFPIEEELPTVGTL